VYLALNQSMSKLSAVTAIVKRYLRHWINPLLLEKTQL